MGPDAWTTHAILGQDGGARAQRAVIPSGCQYLPLLC